MAKYAKAIVGAIVGFVTAFLTALLPFVQQGTSVTAEGWITATIAALVSLGVTGGIVWATPNTEPADS